MAYKQVTPTDISDNTSGTWTDIDVSSYIPSGSIAVLIGFLSTSTGALYQCGVRENDSTDNFTDTILKNVFKYQIVGVDSGRVFEQYISNKKVDTYLIGYFNSGAEWVFNTNWTAIGYPSGTALWEAKDITSYTSSPAKFAIITGTNATYFRPNGSSDPIGENSSDYFSMATVPCDEDEIFEWYKVATETGNRYLIGYATAGNPVTAHLSYAVTAGQWTEDVDNVDNPDVPDTQIMRVDCALTQLYFLRAAGTTITHPDDTTIRANWEGFIPVELDSTNGDYDVWLSAGSNGTAYIGGTVAVAAEGETIEIDEAALDWVGQPVRALMPAIEIPGVHPISWSGKPVAANVVVTEIPATVALDWVGQGMTADETITILEGALDWASLAVAADEVVTVALVSLDWEGQDVQAKIAILIDTLSLDWEGQTIYPNETILTPALALEWAGKALKASERIAVSPTTLDWAGQEIVASTAATIQSLALDWAAKNVYEDEQIAVGATSLEFDGKTLQAKVALLVGAAPLGWSGQDVAVRETIEVGVNPLEYEGQFAQADKSITVPEVSMDWVGGSVDTPEVTIVIDVVALDWTGRNVIVLGQVTRRVRIIGCGFRGIVGG